jgi:hypothetical protein
VCADGERGPPSARAEIFLFLSLSPGSLLILPEGAVVGFCNFVWAPK